MSEHRNVALHRSGHAAFGKGDMDALSDLFTDDTVWHWPGKSSIAGVYEGKAAVFEAFKKLDELSDEIELDDLDFLSSEDRTVSVTRVTAKRGEKTLQYEMCEMVRWRDGQVAEEWVYVDDQYAYDDFWSRDD